MNSEAVSLLAMLLANYFNFIYKYCGNSFFFFLTSFQLVPHRWCSSIALIMLQDLQAQSVKKAVAH